MMKKFIGIMISVILIFNLVGCVDYYTDNETQNQTSELSEQYEAYEEEPYDTSINFENGIAYFDMGADEFVEAYNNSLTSESDYIANNLSSPQYINSGTGVQQITIYQYDVSNGMTKVHTHVHTDENDKIVELVIGIEKQFGTPTVDIDTALYDCLGEMALVLTDLSISEWDILAKGLKRKIDAGERARYYYNGIGLDGYENDVARYYRVSCMTEEMYNNLV